MKRVPLQFQKGFGDGGVEDGLLFAQQNADRAVGLAAEAMFRGVHFRGILAGWGFRAGGFFPDFLLADALRLKEAACGRPTLPPWLPLTLPSPGGRGFVLIVFFAFLHFVRHFFHTPFSICRGDAGSVPARSAPRRG
jgi:hypothetical protein